MMSQEADILYLSWKYEHKEMIYFPKSTWTEGRNRLYEEALKLGKKYEYYIFLDDDISFIEGSFSLFEQYLLKYKPAIGTPFLKDYHVIKYSSKLIDACPVRSCFDACYNAFHHSVLFDDVIFPLNTTLDKKSWWNSQYIVIVLSMIFYPNYVFCFNRIYVDSIQHRTYPRNNDSPDINIFWKRLLGIGEKYLRIFLMKLPINSFLRKYIASIIIFITYVSKKRYFHTTHNIVKNKILSTHKDVISTIKNSATVVCDLYGFSSKYTPVPKCDYTIPKKLKERYFRNFEEYKLNRINSIKNLNESSSK